MKRVFATVLLIAVMTACGHLESEDLNPKIPEVEVPKEASNRYNDNVSRDSG